MNELRVSSLSRTVQNAFEGGDFYEAYAAGRHEIRTTWGNIASRLVELGLCDPSVDQICTWLRISKEDFLSSEIRSFSSDQYGYPGEEYIYGLDAELLAKTEEEYYRWKDSFLEHLINGLSFPNEDARKNFRLGVDLKVTLDLFVKHVLCAGHGIENETPFNQKIVLHALGAALDELKKDVVASSVELDSRTLRKFMRSLSDKRERECWQFAEKSWDRISFLFEAPDDNPVSRLTRELQSA
jgi:hypothetical protein